MKYTYTMLLLAALSGQPIWAQSTNGNSTPTGRENWFPNRGNVGIGTRTPSKELEVIGDANVTGTMSAKNVEAVGLKANTLSVSQDLSVGRNVLVNGFIGIGVASPTERLDVGGNARVSGRITADELVVRQLTATLATINTNLTVKQHLHVEGLTGLGVAAPVEKLEVAGNIKATGALFSQSARISEDATISRNLSVTGNVGLGTIAGGERLKVEGNASVSGLLTSTNLKVDKQLDVQGNLKASGGLSAQSLQVTNDATIERHLNVNGNVGLGTAASASERLTVGGNAYVNGLLTAETLTVKQKLDLKGTFSVAGTLGVGIANPAAALHVNGDGQFDGNIRANKIIVQSIEIAGAAQNPTTPGAAPSVSLGDNLVVNGSLGIGTSKMDGYRLSVNGKIRAGDIIKVYPESEWSDFVFEQNYKLRSLEEVDRYIQQHGHLPEIPSAKQVAKDGIDLGAMDAKLLMKIEELTLYMIALKKENEQLRKEIQAVKTTQK